MSARIPGFVVGQDKVVEVQSVSKSYRLYAHPKDRLKEALNPFGKTYHRDFYALNDVSFTLGKGEILGVLGKNGSGKSTLLKLITGVLQPTSGTITVRGKISALLELGVGFNPEFTGRENIAFYGMLLGASREYLRGVQDDIIRFADIGQYIDQPIKTYSSGMKSRLGFAVAVHIEPEILILDEVLSVGDALFRRKCYAKMEEFFNGGKTIIYVSHDVNSVNKICSRALLLHEGRIVMDDKAAQVSKYYEKLLFASPEKSGAVIEEISQQQSRVSAPQSRTPGSPPSSPAAYCLDGFRSKTAVTYEGQGASILDPRITTIDGKRVNVLVSGEEYIYAYDVIYEKDMDNLTYGMMVKDEKGVILSGASMHLAGNVVRQVEAGQRFRVEWRFCCRLLQGVYFTNAGVARVVDGEVSMVARIVDALIFKVLASSNSSVHGILSLDQTLNVSPASGSGG